MRQQLWTCSGFVFLSILCNFGESRSLVKRQIYTDASLDPALQEVSYDDEDRDKRAVEHRDPKTAIKSALIGILFNPSKGSTLTKLKVTTTTKRPTTTEDIVIFEKGKPVSLELPSQLFGSSFTFVTKASTAVGDYMINSAIRLQRILEVFRPLIRGIFGAKTFVSEVSINKPIFSDGTAAR